MRYLMMLFYIFIYIWMSSLANQMAVIDGSILLAASALLDKLVNKAATSSRHNSIEKSIQVEPSTVQHIPVFEPINDGPIRPSALLEANPIVLWSPPPFSSASGLNKQPTEPYPVMLHIQADNYFHSNNEKQKSEIEFQNPYPGPPAPPAPRQPPIFFKGRTDLMTLEPGGPVVFDEAMLPQENRQYRIRHLPPPSMLATGGYLTNQESKYQQSDSEDLPLDSESDSEQKSALHSDDIPIPVIYSKYPFYFDEFEQKEANMVVRGKPPLVYNNRQPYHSPLFSEENSRIPIESFPQFETPTVNTHNWPHGSKYEVVSEEESDGEHYGSMVGRKNSEKRFPWNKGFTNRKGIVDSIQEVLWNLRDNEQDKQEAEPQESKLTEAESRRNESEKENGKNSEWKKDKGFAKHGWKNVYHKEEWGEAKKYHDVWRFKDWKGKYAAKSGES